MQSTADIRDQITEQAHSVGFDAVGFVTANDAQDIEDSLRQFTDAGHHGSMGWLKDRLVERSHPNKLWQDTRSIIMLGMNYGPATDPRQLLEHKTIGNISVYARGKDYHDVIKKRLKAIGRFMAEKFACQLKVFVDTAPVAEKPLAAAAGLGWQGKHTNVVSRDFGSWLFLGAIYTDLALAGDIPHKDQCGSCQACLDACPTDAFPSPYKIDARRCISYLTIEHKGSIPEEFRKAIGNRIYGCDDCLAACPWNKFAVTANESAFFARAELGSPSLSQLITLDDTAFRAFFSGSPIKRIGRNRFIRNVLIAIGNSNDTSLTSMVRSLLDDPDPVVRESAEWALNELESPKL